MSLNQRLKQARQSACLSQRELAHAISRYGDGKTLSRTAVAQWESGITKEISAANLLKAAKILNVNPEWLQFGTGSADPSPQQQEGLLFTTLGVRVVPFLSFAQAVNYMDIKDLNTIYTGLDEKLAEVIGPHAFALTVKGESMMPEINPGDIVIIDPAVKPLPNEIVLVKLEKEDLVLLRRFHPIENESFELIPANNFWPTITVDADNPAVIIGTLVEHRCRRRLTPPEISHPTEQSNT